MEYRFHCPFCVRRGKTADRRRHLYINPAKNVAHCFRCGYRTRNAQAVATTHGLVIPSVAWHVVPALAQTRRGVPLPPEYTTDWSDPRSRPARRYLATRGLVSTTIAAYEIGYCLHGPYAQRVIVPVYRDGHILHWIGRDWTNRRTPKYVGPRGSGRGVLFNIERAAETGCVLLVEGVFDALRLPEFGVAIFGKQLHREQRQTLFRAKLRRVLVCLDADAPLEAVAVASQLRGCIPEVAVVPIDGDLGNAQPAFVSALSKVCQLETPEMVH